MKKVLALLLVATAMSFAAKADKDGDVILSPTWDEMHGMVKASSVLGFGVGTKGSSEVIRDMWAGSDFDQDGKKELILASYGVGGRAYVYEVDGDNSASLFFDTGDFGSSYSSAVRDAKYGDLDGNGEEELLVSVNSTSQALAGIWAYEYDVVGDSMRAPVQLLNGLVVGDRWYVENFTVGDVDGDGVEEIMFGNNGSVNSFDNFYICSVDSGDFASGKVRTKTEYVHGKSSTLFPAGGSPYGAAISDMDGDGNKEVIFEPWDMGALFIVEAAGPDTFTTVNYIQADLDRVDDFAFWDVIPKDLDSDGRDELYLSMYSGGALYCITCPVGTELKDMTIANSVHKIGKTGTTGGVCTQLGDWDGNGKMDIYASGGGSNITVNEYQGGDPTDTLNWVSLTPLTTSTFSGVYGMRMTEDMDGDGYPEIWGANTGATTVAVGAMENIVTAEPGLFFAEYIEGSGNNKVLDVYNGSDSTLFLGDYSIHCAYNGGSDWNYDVFNFPADSLKPGASYILVNDAAGDSLLALADTLVAYADNKVVAFNGDDARALFHGDNIVDVIGLTNGDPGTNWPVAGGVGATSEFTLIRKNSVKTGCTSWVASAGSSEEDSQWRVFPQNNIKFLGHYPFRDMAPSLIFSEYIEGSSNNKALEIANISGAPINLADYTIGGTVNGGNDWSYCTFNFPNRVLDPNEVYVLTTDTFLPEYAGVQDTFLTYNDNKTVFYNGDDARAIFYGEDIVDVIGLTNGDPGTNWPVAGGAGATSEFTLVRKASVTCGTYDWALSAGTNVDDSQWDVYPQNTGIYLGAYPGKYVAPSAFISEYVESTGNNHALEIYNPSKVAMDLADYAILRYMDGSATPVDTIKLVGTLASKDVFVITELMAQSVINTGKVDSILAGVNIFTGNDCIVLARDFNGDGLFVSDSEAVDIIGVIGTDPGTGWAVGGVADATTDHTLSRKELIRTGNTDWAASAGTTADDTEWEIYPVATYSYLGVHPIPKGPSAKITGDTAGLPGAAITLDGSESEFIVGSGLTYTWSQVSGPTATLSSTTDAVITVTLPADVTETTDMVFSLVVTDDLNTTDEAQVTVSAIVTQSVASARPLSSGTKAAVKGLVTVKGLGNPFMMQDETAGIAIYDATAYDSVAVGDSVVVFGSLSPYNGLVEIGSVTYCEILSTGNPIPAPVAVTVADLDGEAYESQLVALTNVDKVSGTWPGAASSATIVCTSNGVEFQLRIDSDSECDGAAEPTWPVSRLVGIVGDYNAVQIMPRTMDDFSNLTEVTLAAKVPGDASYRSFWVNGSWDNDGAYDSNWSTDLVELTDADGDGVFTGTAYLAANAGQAYSWWLGAENSDQSWIANGADFSVADANPVSTDTLTLTTDWVLSAAGTFNGWNTSATVMTRDGDMWIADSVLMEAGSVELKIPVGLDWNPASPYKAYGAGGYGSNDNITYTANENGLYKIKFFDDNDSVAVEFIVKTDIKGNILPTHYALHDNYPNPFNPTTTINFDLPENAFVKLTIYNAMGQKVVDLVNGNQTAGFYTMQWNGRDARGATVASGVYFYQLISPNFTAHHKMLFLK